MEETIHDVRETLKKRLEGKRVALVGIGNIDKGDDGFGVQLIRRLKHRLTTTLLIEGGMSPENYVGPLIKAYPEAVVLIDAAELRAEPAHTHIVEKSDIAALGLSTHDVSLQLFIAYLEQSLNKADIFLLGTQPKNTQLGSEMSEELRQRLTYFETLFAEVLS